MAVGLSSPVSEIPKVGPVDASRLAKLGIVTVRDLLLHLPFGWDEYGEPTAVAQLLDGKQATVIGTITSISAKRSKYKKMQLTEATLIDDSGGVLKLVWFNQAYMAKQLPKGERVAVAGMVKGRFGVFEMSNPLHEKVSATGPKRLRDLMPRYHLVKGLSSKKVA
ncbi:MAG TPA: OB-fold nucleic acid binding domain-containing protein, partial [Candidatus Dormibacteraeota bacterium]